MKLPSLKEVRVILDWLFWCKRYDTYAALRKHGNRDVLKDYDTCLNKRSLISLDPADIKQMERAARKHGRKVEVKSARVRSIEEGNEMAPRLLMQFKNRDCILMMSGDISIQDFGQIVADIEAVNDKSSYVFAVNDKADHFDYLMTCIAY